MYTMDGEGLVAEYAIAVECGLNNDSSQFLQARYSICTNQIAMLWKQLWIDCVHGLPGHEAYMYTYVYLHSQT